MKTAVPDSLTPFMIDKAGVRGRMVRLAAVTNTVLSRYDYPESVATVLGELIAVAAMLAANLKQEGIFTIQIRGRGLVPLVVVDAAYGGQLRGFAEVPKESATEIQRLGASATPAQLLGKDAYFTITLDPGEGMQRYQGVVNLEGDSITETLAHYFTYSQQIDVLFRLAVGKVKLPGSKKETWLAAGLMVERLPVVGEVFGAGDEHEGWRYASAIAATVKREELLDPMLDAELLLYRLFHEEGVWLQEPRLYSTGCRCSRERIENLLLSMPEVERAEMMKDGHISVHCQFCNTSEKFTPDQVGLPVN